MIPRLKSSKKWTAFPTEFQENILKTFEENFSHKLNPGKFIAESRIYPSEILFRIGFLESGRLFQANFEASIEYIGMDGATQAINLCIDSTASMLEQYYDSQQLMDMPRDWKEFDFDKKKIYLKFSTLNTQLEAEADKILGVYEDHLIQEHDEDELAKEDKELQIRLKAKVAEKSKIKNTDMNDVDTNQDSGNSEFKH